MTRFARIQKPWRKWDIAQLRRNLGVYLHIPFCLARCRYCGFLSYGSEAAAGFRQAAYAALLKREIRARAALAQQYYLPGERVVDTVFLGGGTPTRLALPLLIELITELKGCFPLARAGIELSVEANPDTLDDQVLTQLADIGVNRLSIGVQATQAHHLRFLGRTYRWRDVQPQLQAVAAGKIPRYSFDLLYGVPHLSLSELKESLALVLALNPTHLSAYELTIEPNTPYASFAKRFPQQLAAEPAVIAQQQLIERTLQDRGFYRYEVSSYAQPGAECRHNLRYWLGGDYLGLGLGASSRINQAVIANPSEFSAYQQLVTEMEQSQDPLQAHLVSNDANPDRVVLAPAADRFLQLRTRRGSALDNLCIDAQWLQRGWVAVAPPQLEVTSQGLAYAEFLARELTEATSDL